MLTIVGAGFGRTGTFSMTMALERLGFGPCHHMKEVFEHPEQVDEWRRAAAGVTVDWERLLAGYRSTMDWPAAFFWRELAAAFPSAKVLLTARDPEAWYASVARTIYLTKPGVVEQREPTVQDRMIDEIVWQGTFDGRFTDREHALSVYVAHLEDLRATIPEDRLIEHDVSQGWEPLCRALGVDMPDERFPHVNSSDEYRSRVEQRGVSLP